MATRGHTPDLARWLHLWNAIKKSVFTRIWITLWQILQDLTMQIFLHAQPRKLAERSAVLVSIGDFETSFELHQWVKEGKRLLGTTESACD